LKLWLAAFVHIAAVTNLDNHYDQLLIFDLIDDPINALPEPIPLLPGQFFCPRRSGFHGERL
jgi:hypothetical protein